MAKKKTLSDLGSGGVRWLVWAPVVICIAAILSLAACGGDGFKDPSTLCETDSPAEEGSMTETPEITDEYILEVRDKYRALFKRQPNYHGNGPGNLVDENGEETTIKGITIYVTKKVDQGTLPPEDRIPGCLEGVPVQIIEEGRGVLLSKFSEDTHGEEASGRD